MKNHADLIAFLGGQTAVANVLGISPQAVNKWREIPRTRLAELAIATGRSAESLEDFENIEKIWPELSAQQVV